MGCLSRKRVNNGWHTLKIQRQITKICQSLFDFPTRVGFRKAVFWNSKTVTTKEGSSFNCNLILIDPKLISGNVTIPKTSTKRKKSFSITML